MGRQLNFYLNADDQAKINKIIFESFPDLIVLKDDMEKQELEFLDTTEFKSYIGEGNRVYLTRINFIENVIIDPPRKMTVYPFRVRNILNQDLSPIIEYWRCVIRTSESNGPLIQRGRLYYQAGYYIENYTKKVLKDPEFIKFAQKLFGLFKKNLTYRKEVGDYYGEGALRDEKNGWKLKVI